MPLCFKFHRIWTIKFAFYVGFFQNILVEVPL